MVMMYLHQQDLSMITPTFALGKVMAYVLFISMDTSSTTIKNLVLKAEHSCKIKKKKVVRYEASEDDESTSSLLWKTTKLLKALNKKGYDYNPREKKMVTKKNKSTSNDIKCYLW